MHAKGVTGALVVLKTKLYLINKNESWSPNLTIKLKNMPVIMTGRAGSGGMGETLRMLMEGGWHW